MKKRKKLSIAEQIFIALAVGIAVGLIFMVAGWDSFATSYIKPFGTIFLNLIKFIVVPIVLTSITTGVISMKDIRKVGSIGWKTLAYYFCTTAFAVLIGLVIANLFKGTYTVLTTSGLDYKAAEPTNFMDTLVNIFPNNIIAPMANASMLQVIVIALLFGFGIILAGEKGKKFGEFIESANEVCMRVMQMVIALSPIGVFCLIVPVVAENGPQILGSLALVLLTAYICYILHAAIVYSSTVAGIAKISPLTFFRSVSPAMMMAFSSASAVGLFRSISSACKSSASVRKSQALFFRSALQSIWTERLYIRVLRRYLSPSATVLILL